MRKTAGGITCPNITCPGGGGGGVLHPDLVGRGGTSSCRGLGYLQPGTGVPPRTGRDLGRVSGAPPRKDIGPVKVLGDGDGIYTPSCEQTNKLKKTSRRTSYFCINLKSYDISYNIFACKTKSNC